MLGFFLALNVAGCGGDTAPDPTIKTEVGKPVEESTKGAAKQAPAPVQRTKGGPG